jgi:hypothetical protein
MSEETEIAAQLAQIKLKIRQLERDGKTRGVETLAFYDEACKQIDWAITAMKKASLKMEAK